MSSLMTWDAKFLGGVGLIFTAAYHWAVYVDFVQRMYAMPGVGIPFHLHMVEGVLRYPDRVSLPCHIGVFDEGTLRQCVDHALSLPGKH
jgi:hypothetical protein